MYHWAIVTKFVVSGHDFFKTLKQVGEFNNTEKAAALGRWCFKDLLQILVYSLARVQESSAIRTDQEKMV